MRKKRRRDRGEETYIVLKKDTLSTHPLGISSNTVRKREGNRNM